MTGQWGASSLTAYPRSIHGCRVGGPAVNRVQKFREAALMAKAELARKAGVSESTIDRVESGHDCRMETQRRIRFQVVPTIRARGQVIPTLSAGTEAGGGT